MILLLGQLVNVATGTVGFILVMVERTGWDLVVYAASVAFDIAIAVFLISGLGLGMEGAAIAGALTMALSKVARLWLVWRFVHIQPFDRNYARLAIPTIAALLAGLGAHLLLAGSGWQIDLVGTGGGGRRGVLRRASRGRAPARREARCAPPGVGAGRKGRAGARLHLIGCDTRSLLVLAAVLLPSSSAFAGEPSASSEITIESPGGVASGVVPVRIRVTGGFRDAEQAAFHVGDGGEWNEQRRTDLTPVGDGVFEGSWSSGDLANGVYRFEVRAWREVPPYDPAERSTYAGVDDGRRCGQRPAAAGGAPGCVPGGRDPDRLVIHPHLRSRGLRRLSGVPRARPPVSHEPRRVRAGRGRGRSPVRG